MKIAGPNGLVLDVPEAIATGLVSDGLGGFRFVPDEEVPKPAPKRSARQRKTPTE